MEWGDASCGRGRPGRSDGDALGWQLRVVVGDRRQPEESRKRTTQVSMVGTGARVSLRASGDGVNVRSTWRPWREPAEIGVQPDKASRASSSCWISALLGAECVRVLPCVIFETDRCS